MNKIEIVDRVLAALDAHEHAEVVIVTGAHGSSPRSAGAVDGSVRRRVVCGHRGGGRVEDLALTEAASCLRRARAAPCAIPWAARKATPA